MFFHVIIYLLYVRSKRCEVDQWYNSTRLNFETFLKFEYLYQGTLIILIFWIFTFFSRVVVVSDTTGRSTKRSFGFRSGDKPFRLSLLLIQLCLKSMLIRGHKIFALTCACTESTSEFVAVQ